MALQAGLIRHNHSGAASESLGIPEEISCKIFLEATAYFDYVFCCQVTPEHIAMLIDCYDETGEVPYISKAVWEKKLTEKEKG